MINYKNRGKIFEYIILNSLNIAKLKDKGIFFKSPTVIKPINVSYKNGSPIINKAIFETKALCDFYGIYKSKFILIEAKEIQTNRFNLNNIKKHQIEQLESIYKYGGISFIIFHFKLYNDFLCLTINQFIKLSKEKKSLKYEEIKKEGFTLSFINFKLNIIKYIDLLVISNS